LSTHSVLSFKAQSRRLSHAVVVAMLFGTFSPAFSQTSAGWKTTQDMSKSCQVAFPSNWAVTPDGQATTADGGRAVLVIGSSKALVPLDPGMQKLLQVDRLIENSGKRVFYVMKPVGNQLEYIVDQQFKTTRCKLQLFVPKGYAESDVMKIVAALGSTR
jgi:hypothetical protein